MTRQISPQDRDALIAQAASAAQCWLIVSIGALFTVMVGCAQIL